MVLEKTLKSPLDCKETQPVHSEGDQPLKRLAPSAGDLGSNLGQGTRSLTLQLRVCVLQLKILKAAMKMEDAGAAPKTWHSQIK